MYNKQIIPTALGMSYEEIENLNDVRPYDFETEREKKWYEIGLIDGKEAADVKYAKFAAYEDKTYLSDDFFVRNGFEKRIITNGKPTLPPPTFLYCDDVEEISAQCIDAEMGVWHVSVGFLDHCENTESLNICTLGQFRMFLSICGLDNIVNEFKS